MLKRLSSIQKCINVESIYLFYKSIIIISILSMNKQKDEKVIKMENSKLGSWRDLDDRSEERW